MLTRPAKYTTKIDARTIPYYRKCIEQFLNVIAIFSFKKLLARKKISTGAGY